MNKNRIKKSQQKRQEVQKLKVLYFDDEPFICQSLALNLNLFGWDVTLVYDINDLFYNLKTNQYNILLIDAMAPVPETHNENIIFSDTEIEEMGQGMNTGIVLAKKIWTIEDGKFNSLPILFLSARQRPEIINQFLLSKKKCDWLRKPQLAKTIDEKLKELL